MRLLTDEHIDKAVSRGLKRKYPWLDVVHVADVGLLGTPDPQLLEWAATRGRIVISRDRATLAQDAYERVNLGLPMPGAFILTRHLSIGELIEELSLWVEAGQASDFENRVIYLPLP